MKKAEVSGFYQKSKAVFAIMRTHSLSSNNPQSAALMVHVMRDNDFYMYAMM